jgi:hypothetical protein
MPPVAGGRRSRVRPGLAVALWASTWARQAEPMRCPAAGPRPGTPRGAQILHLSGAVAGFRANCTYGYRMLMLVPFPWIGRWDGLGALF